MRRTFNMVTIKAKEIRNDKQNNRNTFSPHITRPQNAATEKTDRLYDYKVQPIVLRNCVRTGTSSIQMKSAAPPAGITTMQKWACYYMHSAILRLKAEQAPIGAAQSQKSSATKEEKA